VEADATVAVALIVEEDNFNHNGDGKFFIPFLFTLYKINEKTQY